MRNLMLGKQRADTGSCKPITLIGVIHHHHLYLGIITKTVHIFRKVTDVVTYLSTDFRCFL